MNVVPIRGTDPVARGDADAPGVELTLEQLVERVRWLEARLRRVEGFAARVSSVCPIAHSVQDG